MEYTSLRKGDIVRLKKGCYKIEKSNPLDMDGEVISIYEPNSNGFCIDVKWENSYDNSYLEGQLILIKRIGGILYKIY